MDDRVSPCLKICWREAKAETEPETANSAVAEVVTHERAQRGPLGVNAFVPSSADSSLVDGSLVDGRNWLDGCNHSGTRRICQPRIYRYDNLYSDNLIDGQPETGYTVLKAFRREIRLGARRK